MILEKFIKERLAIQSANKERREEKFRKNSLKQNDGEKRKKNGRVMQAEDRASQASTRNKDSIGKVDHCLMQRGC